MKSNAAKITERAIARLKLKQLRLLIAVGAHRNLRNAAREMNISQPAATMILKELELDFEVTLFERTNRGVSPTVYGDTLIRHAKLILAQLAHAAQELDDLGEGRRGRVVVGTLLAASSHLLPRAIEALLEIRPDVSIKVVEGTNEVLMPALRAGEIDLVVGRLPTYRHRDDLVQDKLFDETIHAIVRPGHPLANKQTLTFEDLKPYPWIIPPLETTLRRQLDHFFVVQGQYEPPMAIESISYLTNRALTQSRDFIGIVPAHVAVEDISNGTLARLNWDVPFGNNPIGVSYRKEGRLSPASLALLEVLRTISSAL
ncbi:MAG: LysR substrate-binding domain-containing protein [Planktotalea sp.]|uniref:LysR substrate-binding domain-containing protein n=1 Tax=Planktotalea sp. TaxID=2029877 RepID=UPI003C73914E